MWVYNVFTSCTRIILGKTGVNLFLIFKKHLLNMPKSVHVNENIKKLYKYIYLLEPNEDIRMHKVPGSLVCDKNCSFSYSTLKLLVLLYENVHFRI